MKKIIAIMLCLILLIGTAACGSSGNNDTTGSTNVAGTTKKAVIPSKHNVDNTKKDPKNTPFNDVKLNTVIKADDYILYQNIFFNKKGDDFVNKNFDKEGTFTTIYDAFNNVTRYYVWGYYDNTKCCDWQWELKLDNTSNLPANGSLVRAVGKFEKSDKALDGYWMTGVELTVKEPYKGYDVDYDLTTMSSTLERVEIQNIQMKKDSFDKKTVAAYARVASASTIQHPYYDDAWVMEVVPKGTLPAIGSLVIVKGLIKSGGIIDSDYILSNGF